jgi:exonuclease SbcD
MRAIVCGDAHIGAVFGLGKSNGKGGNTRIDDYEKSLNYIVDYTIDSGADIFVQTGDIFEHREPSLENMAIVDAALKRLSRAGVSTFVIMGNHDYKKNGEAFTSSITSLAAAEYPNVRMILEPENIHVSNGQSSVNLLLVPYRDRRMYPGKTIDKQSEGYNNHIKELVSKIKNQDPTIAIGHNFFFEGSYNDFGGTEILTDPEAFDGCDMVLMGHLHQFRIVRKRAPACVYTGSMEKTNFGDKNVDKFFIDYDSTVKKAKFCKIPSRELLDESFNFSDCDFSNIQERIEQEISQLDLSEKIIRLKLSVDEKILPAVSKEWIESNLYSKGAFCVSKIMIETFSKRIVRDNAVLEQKDDYSMLEAFIKSQSLESDFLEKILKEAKSIVGAK